jgi:hypothetical protein
MVDGLPELLWVYGVFMYAVGMAFGWILRGGKL